MIGIWISKIILKTISSKISKNVGIFHRLKNMLPLKSKISLYYSLIYPYILYANLAWGGTYATNLNSLIVLQKKIIRIISNSDFYAHCNPLFVSNKILKIPDVFKFQLALYGFKSPNLVESNISHSYNTRTRNLCQPAFQRLTICQHSLAF